MKGTPYEDMDDAYGENDPYDTMENDEQTQQVEDETEAVDEKTVAEEEGYPPIHESGDAFDDGLPEVTYYQVEGQKGGYKPIPGTWDHYSGYFPIWKLCYYITSTFKYELHELFGWGLQFMFRAPMDDEAPWVPYERFSAMMSVMTNHVIKKYNLQPTIDCAWEQRQPEDYNGRNVYFRDYQRSWYHIFLINAETYKT